MIKPSAYTLVLVRLATLAIFAVWFIVMAVVFLLTAAGSNRDQGLKLFIFIGFLVLLLLTTGSAIWQIIVREREYKLGYTTLLNSGKPNMEVRDPKDGTVLRSKGDSGPGTYQSLKAARLAARTR